MYEKEIIIFGSDNEEICLDLKEYLIQKNIPFTYYDVKKDFTPSEAEYLVGTTTLPVIFINGEKYIGLENNVLGFVPTD